MSLTSSAQFILCKRVYFYDISKMMIKVLWRNALSAEINNYLIVGQANETVLVCNTRKRLRSRHAKTIPCIQGKLNCYPG